MNGVSSDLIRPATRLDAAAILEIYAPVIRDTAISFEYVVPDLEAFADRVERISAAGRYLVLERDGRVAGYSYATEFRARAAYSATRETSVYVHEDHRGLGIARRLMEELLDQLRGDGAHLAVAGITLPNPASVRLHEKLGFEAVGTFSEVGRKFDRWHDVGFWELRLD